MLDPGFDTDLLLTCNLKKPVLLKSSLCQLFYHLLAENALTQHHIPIAASCLSSPVDMSWLIQPRGTPVSTFYLLKSHNTGSSKANTFKAPYCDSSIPGLSETFKIEALHQIINREVIIWQVRNETGAPVTSHYPVDTI